MGLNCEHGMPGTPCPECDGVGGSDNVVVGERWQDKYSRTIEVKDATVIQVTEYLKDRLLITVTHIDQGMLLNKTMALSEDEIFGLSSILNDWTKKRQH